MFEGKITHIRYVGLRVTNLSEQAEFYRDAWGLHERASGDGLAYFAGWTSPEPFVTRLREDDAPGLDVLSFAVPTPEDVDRYAAHLQSVGARIVQLPTESAQPGGGYALRVFDLDGNCLEIASDVAPIPGAELAERDWRPTALSHVVLNTPDTEASAAWYERALGLRISDRLADVMVFLRADSQWHHIFALARNEYRALNHVAYETRGLEEYLRASGRLMRGGETCVWGPGRHGPGDNTFAYFQDRTGFVCEYTTAIEKVDDWSVWVPRVHPITPEWSDQWGTACARDPKPFLGVRDDKDFAAPPV